jgi:hypothetical protein
MFSLKTKGPDPGAYVPPTMFSKEPKGRAHTFGASFSIYENVYIKGNIKADKNVPGPGTYTLPERVGKDGRHFTIKGRLSNNALKHSASKPGPGTYEPPTSINKTGKYFNSKYKNSMARVMSPSRSVRFPNYAKGQNRGMPGPGTYNPGATITKDGNYFVSQYKSSMCRTFYHCDRDISTASKSKKSNPGPGMYRLPSEFGYYESKKCQLGSTFKKLKRRAKSVEDPRIRSRNEK